MKRTRTILALALFAFTVLFSGCSLTTDVDEIHSAPLPNLENTGGGNEGGTGSSNPPPPGG